MNGEIANPRSTAHVHSVTIAVWFAYLLALAYGSLVPLDLVPIAPQLAWDRFAHLPMLAFTADTRIDWMANCVLGVPTGFLTTVVLTGALPRLPRAFALVLASAFATFFAAGQEFAQLFFPARAASLNDIVAQGVGGLLGSLLATTVSSWFRSFVHALSVTPARPPVRLLEAYLIAYLGLSLFPYDVVLSTAELKQKIGGEDWAWWLRANDGQSAIAAALKLLAEVVVTIPFGLFLGLRSAERRPSWLRAALLGTLLGVSIEIAQVFIASGISQGVSVLTRAAGVCAGLELWNRRSLLPRLWVTTYARRYAPALAVGYLLVLLHANGELTPHWKGLAYAATRLADVRFIPFYYHYYASESRALSSLISVVLMYLPIGLLTAAMHGSPMRALVFGLLASSAVETGKLFVPGLHPDPSNAILGTFAAWGAAHLARKWSAVASASANVAAPVADARPEHWSPPLLAPTAAASAHTAGRTSRAVIVGVTVPTLGFCAYSAATFPTQPWLLLALLSACAAIVWYRPAWLVAIVLAALPILDLAHWSGRFYFDEFDLLLLTVLASGWAATTRSARQARPVDAVFSLAIALLLASYSISAWRGLLPWQLPDANAFVSYYSPFNALRIGKGALWALLLYGFMQRQLAGGTDLRPLLAWGITAGLTLTIGAILWERLTFSGLLNFNSDYRVTGPFSAMHTGGAYIECYLALATPFLVPIVVHTKRWIVRLLGSIVLLAATHAVMVTYSRNGYLAFGIALAVALFFVLVRSGPRWKRGAVVASICGAVFVVALPVFTGQFAQSRMASIDRDLMIRQAHWRDALDMRKTDWPTTLFGMGLGRFPETHYVFSSEGHRSGAYRLVAEADNTFLRLIPGSPLFIGQIVDVEARTDYVVKFDVRADRPNAAFAVPICEKWLLASHNCSAVDVQTGPLPGVWQHFEVRVTSQRMSLGRWFSRRPVQLAIYAGNSRAIVDVDNVHLETARGEDLLRNGDFSQALDHWLFTVDGHLQWHVKSMPVGVLFDQGWFGVFAFAVFSAIAMIRAAVRAWRGDLYAAAALAAYAGFLVVGIFDTLVDAPRFLLMLLLLGWFCAAAQPVRPAARYTR